MAKRIGVIGSRRRNTTLDFSKTAAMLLSIYEPGDIIVSGGCPKGGDRFAEDIAKKYNIEIIIYRPDWSIGRHAGFLRNTTIAENCDTLIACVMPYRAGGTEDTIKKFKKLHPDGKIYLV